MFARGASAAVWTVSAVLSIGAFRLLYAAFARRVNLGLALTVGSVACLVAFGIGLHEGEALGRQRGGAARSAVGNQERREDEAEAADREPGRA